MSTLTRSAAAVVAGIALGVTACGAGSGSSGHALKPQAAPTTRTTAPAPAPPAPGTIGSVRRNAGRPPDLVRAQASVEDALGALDAAAAAVRARGSQSGLGPAMGRFTAEIAAVQRQIGRAYSAGQAGDCAASFAASRAADKALRPTRAQLASIAHAVTGVRSARADYGKARIRALQALEVLYNAVAAHPLVTGPSKVVDSVHASIAANDKVTSDVVRQASGVVTAANKTADSAKQAVKQAALAPCLV
ncbi:MAG: hypothetical protein ACJ735_12470 [Actinomycetes bacterium]